MLGVCCCEASILDSLSIYLCLKSMEQILTSQLEAVEKGMMKVTKVHGDPC
jgi:hypothetical protein